MPRTVHSFGDLGQDREIDDLHKRIDLLASQVGQNAGAGSVGPPATIVQQVSTPETPRLVTADYTLLMGDYWLFVDATIANVVITLLPSAAMSHSVGVIKTDAGANTVTVTAAGSDSINGASTSVLSAQYAAHTFVPDGSAAWGIF